jgi:hypothetical protein
MIRPSVKVRCSLIWSSPQPALYSLGRTYFRQVSASVVISSLKAVCRDALFQAVYDAEYFEKKHDKQNTFEGVCQ